MHTILGAGGAVSNVLQQQLEANHLPVRLISRKPITSTGNTTWVKADLLQYHELAAAAEGSTVIYLCAGLQYNIKVWREQWPVIMRNVINLAKANKARLIFFDNVYMYGLVNGVMTEETPYHPVSAKGEVRAGIADMLMREVKNGELNASILRGADFYGAGDKSFFDLMVLRKYAAGKSAQWLGKTNVKHNFTYIPDAGRAMYLLGQTPATDNQVWHAPTAAPLTGKELMEMAAKTYGVKPGYSTIPKFMLRILGLFNSDIKEMPEMQYQYVYDYQFGSKKFEDYFQIKPTSYEAGMAELKKTMFKPR
ncbi:NAD-dependent epimerase/dehydratase family protein [Deminuibacter soli]|uniref:NAD-dependent epimerase/dehydratase family protein n=1 Tax=Deminuibacter soli TaxID=2291815 RepID=A0A3E1NEB4_9BACT|nr:NAD-dependent epimerase/dehydratase family protein [Deminuibacter soli]RFM26309.1 NAD-dependent epimerase/dehydratase family protein [Deminuibacter soli]